MTDTRRSIAAVAGLAVMLVLVLAGAAQAHGTYESSDPEADSRLDEAPMHVYVNLTEPPTQASTMKVIDGCGRDVIDTLEVVERTLHATLVSTAQPGKWEVRFNVISAADGHETTDEFGWKVTGDKDCSKEASDETSDETSHDEGHGDENEEQAEGELASDDLEGDSFPIVPVAIGVVVLGAAAFGIRAMSKR